MNKSLIATITGVIILAVVGVIVVINNYNNSDNNSLANSSQSTDAVLIENSSNKVTDPDDSTMMKNAESYVTLADYNSDKSSYSESTKILFFHASWCSICQGIEKEINADSSRIPVGTTFIKTDFDSETELRKQYGVTTQYTFVQVDNDGNLIKKWSATSLDRAINGIQS